MFGHHIRWQGKQTLKGKQDLQKSRRTLVTFHCTVAANQNNEINVLDIIDTDAVVARDVSTTNMGVCMALWDSSENPLSQVIDIKWSSFVGST